MLETELGADPQRGDLHVRKSACTTNEVTTVVGVTGQVSGIVLYSMSLATAIGLVSRMMGQEFTEFDALAQSGIGELGNVITGRAGVLLSDAGYQTNITPPGTRHRQGHDDHHAGLEPTRLSAADGRRRNRGPGRSEARRVTRNDERSCLVGTISHACATRTTRGLAVPLRQESAKPKTTQDWMFTVIYVTRLDGSQLVVNADLIETVEHTADTVITLLDGKKLVVATHVDEVVESVIGYRQLIARGPLRLVDTPNLASAAAAINLNHQPTLLRPRETN